jgi:hypothetical protein
MEADMARARHAKKPAAQGQKRSLCENGPRVPLQLSPTVMADPGRANAIIATQSKWVNGTVLHYCFFTSDHFAVPKVQADAVREAFAKWKAIGIGLDFQEVSQLSEAEVRIGYSEADGSSASQVGRDVLKVPANQPTTRYGWDLTSKYGSGTALHEIGHVLGMEHEHQNPFAGIQWHEDAVYASLEAPPNSWDRQTTFHNILEKLTPQQVQGSQWDPDSIMEYEFEAGLIAVPPQYDKTGLIPPGTLSAGDKAWLLKWYPPLPQATTTLQPFQPAVADLAPGQQMDIAIKPTATRKYKIETKGSTDAVLVLFEDVNGTPRYLAGDDDSGEERNASISYQLLQGRNYIARVRLVHPGPSGKTAVMYS